MKVGLIARADDRGLGHLAWETHRHLEVIDRTLVISMGPLGKGYVEHTDRYPGATWCAFNGTEVPEDTVRTWLDGLDVVLSFETYYDWRIVDWAREMRVATVCMAMPEFYKHPTNPQWSHPSVWWVPTKWRLDTMPEGTLVVPVPVPTDRFGDPVEFNPDEPLRVLHVAGKRAMGDRNGTTLMLAAMNRVPANEGVRLTISLQDPRMPTVRDRRVKRSGPWANYWEAYEGHDVLIMPRRFGGLCLPVLEAIGAGMGVVMPNCSPNDEWPIMGMEAAVTGTLLTPGGSVSTVHTDPRTIARAIVSLAAQPRKELWDRQLAARQFAAENSWEVLGSRWTIELAIAVALESQQREDQQRV